MADEKIGATLDAMGVTLDIGEGQTIVEVFIAAKLADMEQGGTALVIGANDGCDWLQQLALLNGAEIIIRRDLNETL